MALESAASNKEIFNVMRAGKDALKQATVDTDVDKVADVMEDITESIQMADEVNEQLSQPIGPQMDEGIYTHTTLFIYSSDIIQISALDFLICVCFFSFFYHR